MHINSLPFNLQFFAGEAGGEAGGAQGEMGNGNQNLPDTSGNQLGNDGNETGEAGGDESDTEGEPETKLFDQDEMKRIAAREKRQGRRSVLKALGVKSEEELKRIVSAYNKMMNPNAPEPGTRPLEQESFEMMEKRAMLAETKLAALTIGVSTDSVDDAVAIASLKAETNGEDIMDVLEDMKTNRAYAGFFTVTKVQEQARSKGTGSSVNHTGAGAGAGKKTGADLGKEIAKMARGRAGGGEKKSSYFKRS